MPGIKYKLSVKTSQHWNYLKGAFLDNRNVLNLPVRSDASAIKKVL